jgi:hypothetical protein
LDAPASALDSKWCSSVSDISVDLDEDPKKRSHGADGSIREEKEMQPGIDLLGQGEAGDCSPAVGERVGRRRKRSGRVARVLGGRCRFQIFI